jgi:hypothetical protein
MSVSRRLRFEILRRDGHRCRYCGQGAPDVALTVDHVVPVALGGTDEPVNLAAACADCNAGKSATSPAEHIVADVDGRALRWRAAMERAAEMQSAERDRVDVFVSEFDDAWCSWMCGDEPAERPSNWRSSVAQWQAIGMEPETLIDLIDDVMPRGIPNYRMWRYFCGAVWNVVKERQAIAQGLVEQDDLGTDR